MKILKTKAEEDRESGDGGGEGGCSFSWVAREGYWGGGMDPEGSKQGGGRSQRKQALPHCNLAQIPISS